MFAKSVCYIIIALEKGEAASPKVYFYPPQIYTLSRKKEKGRLDFGAAFFFIYFDEVMSVFR